MFLAKAAAFTRPSDTTAYAAGDLVANSTTAGSVVVPTLAISAGGFRRSALVFGARLRKTGTTATNASFRIHLYSASPTIATTGDNGVYASVVSGSASHVGALDITAMRAHADGCVGFGVPSDSTVRGIGLGDGGTIYFLLEALAAYTPASAEQFTVWISILED